MNTKTVLPIFSKSFVVAGLLATALFSAQRSEAVLIGPYTADANTVYLFHLDETAGSTTANNAAGALAFGTNAIAYSQNAANANNAPLDTTVLGAAGAGGFSFGNFGNAAFITNAVSVTGVVSNGLGIDMNLNGAFQLNNGGGSGDTLANSTTIFGTYNSFTIEALVNMPNTNTANREIVCTDSAEGTRGFQFRLIGTRIEVNFINGVAGQFFAILPTTGPHAFVSNAWFHVALTHTEVPVPGGTNSIIYWTRLGDSFTAANPIVTNTTATATVVAPLIIVIGNEARATGGSSEGLNGMIDEVRISRAALAPVQMLFADSTVNSIYRQPSSTTVASGQPASFSAIGAGLPPLGYQWYKSGAGGDSVIPNATNSTYNIAAAGLTDATNYYVVVTNLTAGPATSSVVSLTLRTSVDSLAWRGTNTAWNFTVANWSNTVTTASLVAFQNGDNVSFGDGNTNLTLNLTTTVMPGSITVNSSSNYTFQGPGNFAGPMGITKSGTGTLTIGNPIAPLVNPNTFTGNISVTAGILRTANGSALGATNGTTTVNGGTFDVNGQSLGFETFVVQGDGVNGTNGAINNAGGQQQSAIRYVTLTGDTTFNASNQRWDIHNNNGAGAQFLGNGFKLTKRGGFDVYIKDTGDTGLGTIDILQGGLGFQGFPMGLGNAAATMTVFPGATFAMWDVRSNSLNKILVLTNGNVFSGGGSNDFIGPITLQGTNTIITDTSLRLAGSISGGGGFNKNNAATVFLDGNNSYSGPTFVNGGQITLGVNSTFGNSSLIRLATGTTVDVSGATKGLTLGAGQTLAGVGTVTGFVTNNTGSFLSPGTSVGTLSINGDLTLNNATNLVELSSDPFTIGGTANDLCQVFGTLNLSGVNTIKILPIAPLSAAAPYTVMTYNIGLNGTAANLQITSDNPRYSLSVVDPATTPGAIQITVTGNPTPLIWKGGKAPNPIAWDHTVTNWLNTGTLQFDKFFDGDLITFDDTAATNQVAVLTTNTVGLASFSNDVVNYTFTGSGMVAGSFVKEGTGTVTFAFSNPSAPGFNFFTNDAGTVAFNMSSNATLATVFSDLNGIGGTILKQNSNELTLTADNSAFNGLIVVASGSLAVGNNAALGSVFGGTVVSNGARVFLSGNRTIGEPLTINGGYDGIGGALQAGGAGNGIETQPVTLGSNSRVAADTGSTLRLQGGVGGNAGLTVGGAGNTVIEGAPIDSLTTNSITKVDAGLLVMSVDSTSYDGPIFLNAGSIRVSANSGLGTPVGATVLQPNTTLDFFFNAPTVDEPITIIGLGTAGQGAIHTGGGATCTPILLGPITLSGDALIKMDGGTILSLSNSVSGNADLGVTIDGNGPCIIEGNVTLGTRSLIKASSGQLVLRGAGNAWSGQTIIVSGSIALGTGVSLGTSSFIAVGTNQAALLDATLPGLSLGSGQTLAGLGTVRGETVIGSGATLSAGYNGVGTLTFNTNTLTFNAGSTNAVDFTKSGTVTCDLVANLGTVNMGGTLRVSNVGVNPLAAGDALKIFAANTYAGSFATISPATPGTGLVWDTSTLNTDGTLRVAAAASPQFTQVSTSGTNVVMSGSGGTANGGYSVLSHTNLAVPVTSWPVISTGTFDGSGNFSVTNGIALGEPVRFYRIRTP